MEVSQVLYQFNSDDHFLHQLERMNRELKALAVIIDANSRAQQMARPPQSVVHRHQWQRTPKPRTPTLVFPFSLLAQCIDGTLTRCDHAIGTWVKEGIIARWMRRFFAWQRQRRRT